MENIIIEEGVEIKRKKNKFDSWFQVVHYGKIVEASSIIKIKNYPNDSYNPPEGLNILHLFCGERSTIFGIAIV